MTEIKNSGSTQNDRGKITFPSRDFVYQKKNENRIANLFSLLFSMYVSEKVIIYNTGVDDLIGSQIWVNDY